MSNELQYILIDEKYLPDDQQEDSDDIKDFDIFAKSKEVVTWGTDWTAFTVVDQIKRGIIDLKPKFQRRQAWSVAQRSDLILSLLNSIPVPQIVLAENPKQRGKYIVIDGKQRLLALVQFIGGDDRFESYKLKTDYEPLRNKSYADLEEDHRNSIDNAVIRTVVLKNAGNDFLYTVFLKLNMGSSKLSPQELRQALVPGPFIDYVDDLTVGNEENHVSQSMGLRKITRLDAPDPRMRDTELMLRYFAYVDNIRNYGGNLKRFLDEFSAEMNLNWATSRKMILQQSEEFERAAILAEKIFGENQASRKWNGKTFENRLNRAVFDVQFYYFSQPKVRQAADGKENDILVAFKRLCIENMYFKESIESSTKDPQRTKNRLEIWGKELQSILGDCVSIPYDSI
jgi:Protein of unknown function DUF262